jgi:hypothetical protein
VTSFPPTADAARNVDLLLGTRGWRRFVWRNDDAAKQAMAKRGVDATAFMAREGFSQTPQVASNFEAAKAPGAALARSAQRSERDLRDAATLATVLLATAVVGEGLAWQLRRTLKSAPVVQVFVGVGGATALLLFRGPVCFRRLLGAQVTGAKVTGSDDFDFAAPARRVFRDQDKLPRRTWSRKAHSTRSR